MKNWRKAGPLWLPNAGPPPMSPASPYKPQIFRPPAAGGGGGFTYYSAVFDGTNDVARRATGLTGETDGNDFLFSCWIKMDTASSDTGDYYILGSTDARVRVQRVTDGSLRIILKSTADAYVWWANTSANSCIKASGWVHLMGSRDVSTTTQHLYLNGVSDLVPDTNDAGTQDWTSTNWEAGALASPVKLCEFYCTDEYLDLSNASNRAKFRTAGGKPENLGADGSTPTGTQPLMYFHNQVPDWHNNLGRGGTFTQVGAIADGGADIP